MAYLDSELRNARLFWWTIADRVLVVGLILGCFAVAGQVIGTFGVPTP